MEITGLLKNGNIKYLGPFGYDEEQGGMEEKKSHNTSSFWKSMKMNIDT